MSIIIEYKILDKDIKLPDQSKNLFRITIVSLSRKSYRFFYTQKLSGKISYSFEESEKFKICIETTNKDIFVNKKFVYLEFKVQSYDDLYDENTATAKDFFRVNDTMTKLNNKVDNIETIQDYTIKVEDSFSKKQINSSSRLVYVSLCQIAIICIVGIYHIMSLRAIFKNKIWTPF